MEARMSHELLEGKLEIVAREAAMREAWGQEAIQCRAQVALFASEMAEAEARVSAACSAACAQVEGLVAFAFSNHPKEMLNGVYRRVAEWHEGWPHYASASGMHLYYYVKAQVWHLDDSLPHEGSC